MKQIVLTLRFERAEIGNQKISIGTKIELRTIWVDLLILKEFIRMYNINIISSNKAENVFQHEDTDDTEQASKLL